MTAKPSPLGRLRGVCWPFGDVGYCLDGKQRDSALENALQLLVQGKARAGEAAELIGWEAVGWMKVESPYRICMQAFVIGLLLC